MLIVDLQIHIWENGKMSAHHRQIPTYDVDDALAEMKEAGVDAAVLHPPSIAGRGGQRPGGRGGQGAPRQILHPRAFRPRSAEQGGDRPQLALAAGDGRLPLHVQPAAPEALLDRRLARLVLGGLREAGLCRRPAGRRLYEGIRQDRRDAIPASKSISTISAGMAAAPAAPTSRPGPISPTCWRWPNCPMSAVKMSGAPSYSSQPYPYKNIHGYLRQIFDAFGPHRCFWGTDITRMPCSYRQCVTMFTEELPWLQGQRQGAGDGPRGLRMARLEASRAECVHPNGMNRRIKGKLVGVVTLSIRLVGFCGDDDRNECCYGSAFAVAGVGS